MRLCAVLQALVCLGLVGLLVQAVSGQGRTTHPDRFMLFNACRPVTPTSVLVASLDQDEKDRVRALVERRLRIAHLYDEDRADAGGHLSVTYATDGWAHDPSDLTNIGKFRPRVTVRVVYRKNVTDEFGNSYNATTWESVETILLPPLLAIGDIKREIENGGRRAVSDLLDEFIDDYLRVNSEACGSPQGAQP